MLLPLWLAHYEYRHVGCGRQRFLIILGFWVYGPGRLHVDHLEKRKTRNGFWRVTQTCWRRLRNEPSGCFQPTCTPPPRSGVVATEAWRWAITEVTMEPDELLRNAYAAFNARDIDGALALMHLDVAWPTGIAFNAVNTVGTHPDVAGETDHVE